MTSLQQEPAYQPGYDQSGSSTYTFDSAPNTIGKQQDTQGMFQQAGGARAFSAPPPPPLPSRNQTSTSNQNQSVNLHTRNWQQEPWHSQVQHSDTYAPPSSSQEQQSWNSTSSSSNIPTPPALPGRSFSKQRRWNTGPYSKVFTIKTHNWGNRTENGWSGWNRGGFDRTIGGIENNQALAFNNYWSQNYQSQSRGLGGQQQQLGGQQQQLGSQQLGGQQLGGQQFGGQQLGGQQFGGQQIGGQQFGGQQLGGQQFGGQGTTFGAPNTTYTTTVLPPTIISGPALGTGFGGSRQLGGNALGGNQLSGNRLGGNRLGGNQLGGNQGGNVATGRKGRSQRKKAAKKLAIANVLQGRMLPPAGDPEVNHYRRGAAAVVPLAGSTGGLGGRRTRKNRGHHHSSRRGAGRVLPVPATQPPIVAPIPVQQSAIPITSTRSTLYSSGLSQPISTSYGSSGISSYGGQSGLSSGISQPISSSYPSSGISSYGGQPGLASGGITQPQGGQYTSQGQFIQDKNLQSQQQPQQQQNYVRTGGAAF